jgi:hypothetical protein
MSKRTAWRIGVVLTLLAMVGCNRDSGNATDVKYDGFLEGAQSRQIWGWAWDKNHPDTHVSVDILDGDTVLATVTADKSRPDLATASIGKGDHAFSYPPPIALKDGRSHAIRAKVSGSGFELQKSPLTKMLR